MPEQSRNWREALSSVALWMVVYVGASLASVFVLVATGQSATDQVPMWALAMNVGAMWAVYLTVMPRLMPFQEGRLSDTFGSWFTRRDLVVGVPLGVASQLVLMNLVNWPLSRLFPDQFSPEQISQRAEEIADMAPGWWAAVLVAVVVVGAPIVEEIVYRGCLQTRLSTTLGTAAGVTATSAIFALVHLTPVELPGLFVFALVLGAARHRTGSLGLPIVTHMAFNAVGLSLVMVL